MCARPLRATAADSPSSTSPMSPCSLAATTRPFSSISSTSETAGRLAISSSSSCALSTGYSPLPTSPIARAIERASAC